MDSGDLKTLAKLLNYQELPEKKLYFFVKRKLQEGIYWEFKDALVHPPEFWNLILEMLVYLPENTPSTIFNPLINPNFPKVFLKDQLEFRFFKEKNMIYEFQGSWENLIGHLKELKYPLKKGITKVSLALLESKEDRLEFEDTLIPKLNLGEKFYLEFKDKSDKLGDTLKSQRDNITMNIFLDLNSVSAWRYLILNLNQEISNEELLNKSKTQEFIILNQYENAQERFKKTNWAEDVDIQEILEYSLLMP